MTLRTPARLRSIGPAKSAGWDSSPLQRNPTRPGVAVAATDRSGSLLDAEVVVVALLVAAFAVGGLRLSRTAYRGGLGAPLAVVTLANPMAAAAIGLSLLGEGLRGGVAGMLLAVAGASVTARGVVLLTRVRPVEAQPTEHASVDEDHPVAAVPALEPRHAPTEPSLLPRRPSSTAPGHLTPL